MMRRVVVRHIEQVRVLHARIAERIDQLALVLPKYRATQIKTSDELFR
jgi:hypothetical protein